MVRNAWSSRTSIRIVTEETEGDAGAMADLDFIGRGGRKTMPKDSPDRKRWDKTSAMLIDMFDIRVHTLHGIRDKSQADRMKTLKSIVTLALILEKSHTCWGLFLVHLGMRSSVLFFRMLTPR